MLRKRSHNAHLDDLGRFNSGLKEGEVTATGLSVLKVRLTDTLGRVVDLH
jgi:hypothetical protein